MKLPLSGVTRSSAGPVRRVHSRSPFSFKRVFLDDANDAFWLAQTYFMTNQYSRAERLLTRPFPTKSTKRPPTSAAPTNGHLPSTSKGKGREYDVSQLMLSMPRLPMGPGGLIELPEELQDRVSRLVDMSVACRYLAALCQVSDKPESDS